MMLSLGYTATPANADLDNLPQLPSIFGRLFPLVSVKKYGAKGDGGTFDDAAFAQALAEAYAIHGTVYVPATSAYYRVSADIALSGAVRITGDGVGSKIQNDTPNLGVFSILDGVSDVEISHLYLASTGALNVLGRACIYINPAAGALGVNRVRVSYVRMDHASTSGITCQNLRDSSFDHIHCDNLGTGEHGVYFSNSGGDCTSCTLESSILRSATSVAVKLGVQIRGCSKLKIHNVEIRGFYAGMYTSVGNATTDSEFSNMRIYSPGTDGIDSFDTATLRSKFTNIQVFDAGRNGIRSDGGFANCQFSAIFIANATQCGMRFNTVTQSSFADLRIRDCGSAGVSGDDGGGIRLAANNVGNEFRDLTISTSNSAAFYQYALSIGGGGTNTGNKFRSWRFDPGKLGVFDITGDFGGLTFYGDATVNVAVLATDVDRPITAYFNVPLTASRDYAINTAGVPADTTWLIVRSANATGAFNLNVKTSGGSLLKALGAASSWCRVRWDGTNLLLTENGTL